MNELNAFLPQTNIAYFTMELALRVEVHTYAGGLGVLAGDRWGRQKVTHRNRRTDESS